MFSFSNASKETLRQTFDNTIARIDNTWSSPDTSQSAANKDAATARSLEPPVATDDNLPTFEYRQLWYNRLEVATRYSEQGKIDEMTSHIRQTGEIIDSTLRYLRYQETGGDVPRSAPDTDKLTEYGEEIKQAMRVLLDRCQAADPNEAATRGGGGSGDPSVVA